jgi:hypothetical protein
VSVRIDRIAKTLDLGFRAIDDRPIDITFGGVVMFRIADALLQNVVSKVLVAPSGRLLGEEIHRVVTWLFSSAERKLTVDPAVVEAHAGDILKGKRRLFYLDPSWGAEIAVLCTTIVRSDE